MYSNLVNVVGLEFWTFSNSQLTAMHGYIMVMSNHIPYIPLLVAYNHNLLGNHTCAPQERRYPQVVGCRKKVFIDGLGVLQLIDTRIVVGDFWILSRITRHRCRSLTNNDPQVTHTHTLDVCDVIDSDVHDVCRRYECGQGATHSDTIEVFGLFLNVPFDS